MIIGSSLRRSLARGGWLTALAAALLLGAALPASADYYDAVTAYDRADYAVARAELEPLAAAGDARAQLLLGRMHAAGQGVLQDYVRAHLLLNLAAASGIDGASEARDELAGRMTPQQIADAQSLAAAWMATPAAGATAPHPLDRQGLVDLQWQLALHGYDPGPADGVAGRRTAAAIRRYQADAALPVDGMPDRALLDHLQYTVPAVRNAAAPESAAASQPAVLAVVPGPLDSLNPGLKRSYVVGIQQALKARGYNPGPIDGVAGPRTRDAVRRYQRSVGLAVDGLPSPALLNHLKFVGGRVAASN